MAALAAVPLSYAVPAAAASLAYLNAKYTVGQDLGLAGALIPATIRAEVGFKRGKGNLFYLLEDWALSPKTAGRPFLAAPPKLPKGDNTPASLKTLECEEYTFKQLYDKVLSYAAWLKQEHGVRKDDIIALDCTNKPLFIFLWFAIWSLGARPAFINTGLRGDALLHCVKTSSAGLFLVDGALQDVLSEKVVSALPTGSKDGGPVSVAFLDKELQHKVSRMPGFRAEDSERLNDPLDMALLIFTSGTTGLPKAATVNWRRCRFGPMIYKGITGLKQSDRYYTALPLYHSSASLLCFLVSLVTGATVIISPHFSPRSFFPSVIASKATAIQYIGEMCRYLLTTPPAPTDTAHSVRLAVGNGMRPDVWKQFKYRYNIDTIVEFYAATESPLSTMVRSRNDFCMGTVGRAGPLIRALRPGHNIFVKHDVDTGLPLRDAQTGFCVECKTGEVGELVGWLNLKDIKDKFAGYWGNAGATDSKILRDVKKKGDAYFRTGDLMRIDHDGRIFFIDRIGDTFRWKGENVSTGEVEKVVAAHPSIAEANVYGIELPGHDGRAGCAAIIFNPGAGPDGKTLAELAEHLRDRLPKYAVPLFLRRVKAMEVTGTSKYTKHGLRTQGVDPKKVGKEDVLYWLEPRSGRYERFEGLHWDGIVGGQTKL